MPVTLEELKELIFYIKQKNIDEVRRLLIKEPLLLYTKAEPTKYTLLVYAVRALDPEIVTCIFQMERRNHEFVSRSSIIYEKDATSFTVLHFLARKISESTVEALPMYYRLAEIILQYEAINIRPISSNNWLANIKDTQDDFAMKPIDILRQHPDRQERLQEIITVARRLPSHPAAVTSILAAHTSLPHSVTFNGDRECLSSGLRRRGVGLFGQSDEQKQRLLPIEERQQSRVSGSMDEYDL